MIDPVTLLRAAEVGLPAEESHPGPTVVCFPLRTDWEQTLPVDLREPFPAPVRTSRLSRALTFPCPSPVLALNGYALERSWEVRTQYSCGYFPHGTTGKPSVLKDVIALRFGAHPMTDRQAYAIYSRNASGGSWMWSSVMIWGPDLPPFGGFGITELTEWLEHVPALSAEGMAFVVKCRKAYLEQQAAETKQRAKDAPKKSVNREGMQ